MQTPVNERFPRDTRFDVEFDRIPNLFWYPYVGQDFQPSRSRVMVFAHNIPIPPDDCETTMQKWKSKDAWADKDTLGEYTYCRGWWTKPFRYFVKGSVGLQEDYDENSPPEVTERVDAFIRRISYINYIQGVVPSERQMANAPNHQVEMSQEINRQFLSILGVTHCICWGKHVYDYLMSTKAHKVLEEKKAAIGGFATAVLESEPGRFIRLLKTYHPSMPSFRPYSAQTQTIISEFLREEPVGSFTRT